MIMFCRTGSSYFGAYELGSTPWRGEELLAADAVRGAQARQAIKACQGHLETLVFQTPRLYLGLIFRVQAQKVLGALGKGND